MLRLVIDDKIPFIREAAAQLGACTYLPGAAIGPDDVRDADVLITRTRTRVDATLLEGSKVRLVVTATIGHDHLDTDFLARKGIAWHNCPGCNAESVAQYVRNSLWIAAAEGVFAASDDISARKVGSEGEKIEHNVSRAESLDRSPVRLCANLSGLKVGIVGVGHVGSAVADALEAEGCRVLRCDPPKGEPYTLDDLAREADVITLHTPLTRSGACPTFHLADRAFFEKLRRCRLFINAARGECADTAAVKQALAEGKIGGAVIDTWENEPNISRTLLRNALIATPHIAGYSADGKANGTRMALEAVARHFGLSTRFEIRPPRLPDDFDYGALPETLSDRLPDRALRQLRLYNPLTDTARLQENPQDFELLRGNYPLRREIER